MELSIDAGDVLLPATLDAPSDGSPRGAMVVLHGSAMPQRSYFLYEHLARELPLAGVAVLRFDRRPRAHGDVPFAVQADDALAAVTQLRRRIGEVPVGAVGLEPGHLAGVHGGGPLARPGRFPRPSRRQRSESGDPDAVGTAQQLLQRGYGVAELADLACLREALESTERGHVDRTTAQAVVDRYADRPWFPLAHVPSDLLGYPGTWDDIDHDPAPVIAQVRCPTLLFYGESDEWTPAEDSIAVWRRAAGTGDLTIGRLAGCTHLPTLGGTDGLEAVSPDYTSALLAWIGERISR